MAKPQPKLSHRPIASSEEEVCDLILVQEARAGGDRAEQAFAQLRHRHKHRLDVIVGAILNYSDDVPDVVQQALFKAFRSIAQFKGDSKFSTWLCAIAKNLAIDQLRIQKRFEQDIPLEDACDLTAPPQLVPNPDVAIGLQLAEQLLAQRKEPQRTIIRLVCWEERSPADVAGCLGISPSTVYEAVKHFRRQLRLKMLENRK